MKTFSSILSFFLLLMLQVTVNAQNKDKVGPALNGFLQTDFMLKFQDMSSKASTVVQSFQAQSFNYPPHEVARVKIAYDKTARRFNQVLINIKADFLDNNKLKLISNSPEYYAKGLELEMYQLNDFYAQNFQQAVADVTGNQIDGNPVVLLLVQLISGISGTMDHFSKIKKEARRYNDQYLNQHLVQPYRFKMWDEITGGSTGGNLPYAGGAQPSYEPNGSQFPYGNQDPSNPYGGQGGYDPYNQGGNTPPSYDPYNQGGNQQPNYNPYNQENGGNQPTTDPFNQGMNTNNGTPTNQPMDWTLPQNNGNGGGFYDGGSMRQDSTKRKKAKAPNKDHQ